MAQVTEVHRSKITFKTVVNKLKALNATKLLMILMIFNIAGKQIEQANTHAHINKCARARVLLCLHVSIYTQTHTYIYVHI